MEFHLVYIHSRRYFSEEWVLVFRFLFLRNTSAPVMNPARENTRVGFQKKSSKIGTHIRNLYSQYNSKPNSCGAFLRKIILALWIKITLNGRLEQSLTKESRPQHGEMAIGKRITILKVTSWDYYHWDPQN